MSITLRYFAAIREITGRTHETLTLPPDATIVDAQIWLTTRYPALAPILERCQVARNRVFTDSSTPLADGDEVVFLPPMAGG
jgi:molybdopterin converting factor subunit 1